MVWYDPLFLGTGCQSKLKKLKRRISRRTAHTQVYLITLPTHSSLVLEVIPSTLLLQEHYPAGDLQIIGMAFSRGEALRIVERIISDSFNTRGDVDIEAYLSDCGSRRQETA